MINNFKRNSFLQSNRRHSRANHGENVTILMQQVQFCPWNMFKLNELSYIESGLQEVGYQDSRISQIISKLANSCVFVEHERKIEYLKKDSKQKRSDADLMTRIDSLRKRRDRIKKQIELYREKLKNLNETEEYTLKQIAQLKKSNRMIEVNCGHHLKKFESLYEFTFSSFESNSETIKRKLPQFLRSINQSNLVKQLNSLKNSHDAILLKLALNLGNFEELESDDRRKAMLIIDYLKSKMYEHLDKYLKNLTTFNQDLTLIDELYSSEIPEEIEYIKAMETHVHFLEKPIKEAPKRIKILNSYSDNNGDIDDDLENVIGDYVDANLDNI